MERQDDSFGYKPDGKNNEMKKMMKFSIQCQVREDVKEQNQGLKQAIPRFPRYDLSHGELVQTASSFFRKCFQRCYLQKLSIYKQLILRKLNKN